VGLGSESHQTNSASKKRRLHEEAGVQVASEILNKGEMDTVEDTGPAVKRRYDTVNATWPTDLPTLTPREAITAAKRLYRFGMKRPFRGKVKLTSGNRYTWPRGGVLYVNPDRGWPHLVHMISHLVHRRTHADKRPHDFRHEFLEGEMVRHVVKSGWLTGKLRRPEKAKPQVRQVRYDRILARLSSWERKAKRAATAIRKLLREAGELNLWRGDPKSGRPFLVSSTR
jgi:hypothetical protein